MRKKIIIIFIIVLAIIIFISSMYIKSPQNVMIGEKKGTALMR